MFSASWNHAHCWTRQVRLVLDYRTIFNHRHTTMALRPIIDVHGPILTVSPCVALQQTGGNADAGAKFACIYWLREAASAAEIIVRSDSRVVS